MASRSIYSQVITKAVESVQFNFYSEKEVKACSVKPITSPILFDNLNRPAPDGLYDLALGPIELHDRCSTCRETSSHCSGHCGHIELALPVYNPLLFRYLVKILKQTCTFCHRFSLSEEKMTYYANKLDRIRTGDIVNAEGLSSEKHLDDYCATPASRSENHSWTSLQLTEVMETLNSMMTELKMLKKCASCNLKSPKIASPAFGRIYQSGMSKGDVISNLLKESEGMVDDVIDPSGGEESISAVKNKSEKKRRSNNHSEKLKDQFLSPLEVREHLKRLWQNESRICSVMWDLLQEKMNSWNQSPTYEMFFLKFLLVPPNRFRPPNKVGNMLLEHPQNVHYGKVLQANMYLEEALRPLKGEKKSLIDIQVINRWINLQDTINLLIDSSTNSMRAKDTVGVRQLLEKKEGLFRQNMMGKRVNHACRSVISPDPYLAVNEIGIPPCFASKLTYPEKVTHWNEEKLREAVQNGPSVYPGATHYEDEQGIINLASMSQHQLNALAKKLLSTPGAASTGGSAENIDSTKVEGKIVYRHLQDGDVLLVNRQPTLHKPSMMAHVARVLKGEKTLRMHYANCSTYNADFDGDEMNVHFPQDEISRAEAYNIVDANQQYTVPSSGKPIRGLIQDHIVSATLLTKKDVFLTREEFQNLVYNACVLNTSPFHRQAKDCPKVSISKDDSLFITMPPALWKPKRLWTGKQVISAILHYITKGRPPFSSKKSGKVEDDPNAKGVLIKDNEMIFGIIDKEQFGKYGLVHVVHELYGAEIAGCLLSIFSRLFTAFLQMHGFTCGAVDLLLVPKAEDERRKKLEEAKNLGKEVHLQFICQYSKASEYCQMEEEIEKILRSKGQTASRSLDDRMISALNKITSGVTKATVSDGLLVKFPKNCLSLMTATGAKGSMVNFYQISSLLGQQELEGKRVPRMVSGKTLPCFPPWDSRPRAGGFISDRFLTGLHPQEYYFHCMAGRDGLVDTAVKTSTSGYLQRCLIKNLECLTVFYDQTVRDSDGSVVQFKYGEDGVDVTKRFGEDGEKAKGMRLDFAELEVIATNQSVLGQRLNHDAFDDFNGSLRNSNLDSYSDQFPESRRNKVREFLDHLTEKEKELLQVKNPKNFFDLLHLKYISSLAQPGEAVGIIAGQSIGEPSTQMTLNTFHHAGRGEVNVTMGVPRLREILMTASKNISKAYMICPLKKGKTREDAERIASKLRRIRFADLIESMDVGTVPFVVRSGQVQTIYKVRIKMYPEESYPPYSDITLEKCKTVFDTDFADKLNKEVKKVLKKSKKDDETAVEVFKESQFSEEAESLSDEDDQSNSGKAEKFDDEDEEDVEMDDEGADAQKRKAQATDEMDYEDEEDVNERSMVSDFSVEDNNVEVDDDDKAYSEYANSDGSSKNETPVEIKASPSSNGKQKKKRNENVVAVTRGRIFECEFPIKENKHILLVPIVEKVANTIYLQMVPNIQGCNVIESKEYPGIPTIQTQGINIEALWKLSEELDVHRLHTNDISTVLELYGVEAAYATIMREVRQVFDHYGIAVNPRHLSLIADFMTFNGGYKPLNRTGISANISPFLKVSFETATKFLVNSCMHGEKDCLESPSSRIVLGQVAKVGTGCFDVLQNLHG